MAAPKLHQGAYVSDPVQMLMLVGCRLCLCSSYNTKPIDVDGGIALTYYDAGFILFGVRITTLVSFYLGFGSVFMPVLMLV